MLIHILFFVFILAGLVWYLENKTVFVPSRTMNETPKDIGLDFEDIYFDTEDKVTLNGWFIPAPGAKVTLLFMHGNAGNISHRLEKILLFHQMGLNIFIFDYRGYGRSHGRPSEKGLYRDTLAAYEYLQSRRDIAQTRIIAYGASLGGVPAVDIASKKPLAGLIVDSSFSSGRDMSKAIFPFLPKVFMLTKLDSISKIKDIKIPKLFIHSVNDDVVPFELGKKLFDAAPSPKTFVVLQGDHNNGFLEEDTKFVQSIQKFLSEIK